MLENYYGQNKHALIQFHNAILSNSMYIKIPLQFNTRFNIVVRVTNSFLIVVLDYYRKQQTSKMNMFRKTNCLPLAYII